MKRFLILPAILASIPVVAANTSVPAFDVKTEDFWFVEFALQKTNGMYGWTFDTVSPVTVTAIGWYDDGLDGLRQTHEIGLWNYSPAQTGMLLTQLTISSGTNTALDGFYRKMELPEALTLEAGSYVVAGTYDDFDADPVMFVNTSLPHPPHIPGDPRIAVGGPAVSEGGGFRGPDMFMLVYGFELGPMLFVEPIPEPSTAGLAGLVSLLLISGRVLKRVSSSGSGSPTGRG